VPNNEAKAFFFGVLPCSVSPFSSDLAQVFLISPGFFPRYSAGREI